MVGRCLTPGLLDARTLWEASAWTRVCQNISPASCRAHVACRSEQKVYFSWELYLILICCLSWGIKFISDGHPYALLKHVKHKTHLLTVASRPCSVHSLYHLLFSLKAWSTDEASMIYLLEPPNGNSRFAFFCLLFQDLNIKRIQTNIWRHQVL